jgi:glutaredoxin
MAKEFLSSSGVEFESVDVSDDPKAMDEMVEKTGAMSTPVIIIGDDVVQGWNQEKVAHLLHLNQE